MGAEASIRVTAAQMFSPNRMPPPMMHDSVDSINAALDQLEKTRSPEKASAAAPKQIEAKAASGPYPYRGDDVPRFTEKEYEYVKDVLDRRFDTQKNSKYNVELEKQFAEKFNMPFGIGMVNGTCTMQCALVAEGIGKGDEVIVPPMTMASTSLAVLQCGATPVFADIEDGHTLQICPKSVEACITPRTKAILTVALYGSCPDYDPLMALCEKHNLVLIEDNAENFLGTYKGKLVGEIGHYSSFSFQASKHMTCGEGGMLLIKDAAKADFIRRFSCLGYGSVGGKKQKITRSDLQDPLYNRHMCLGYNFRMSELQAACSLGQLERLEDLVSIRVRVGNMFNEVIKDFPFLLPTKIENCEERTDSFWAFTMVLNVEDWKLWYGWKELWNANNGDFFYACWKLTYQEDYFQNEVQDYEGITQQFKEGLCPKAEWTQKRLIAMKTNYWDLGEARAQCVILRKTAEDFQKKYL